MTLVKKTIEDTEPSTEIEVPQEKKGTVNFLNAAGFANPAPVKLKRVLAALRYFCVGLITAVSATDLFSGYQSKMISFCLGVVILLLGAVEMGTGVQSEEDKKM